MTLTPNAAAGTVAPQFARLRQDLQHNIDTGRELGASIAVVVDDQLVVDLWGGHKDHARSLPWERDTIVNLWSLTKPVTALAALVLVDSGELVLDQPVSYYWPEFAQNGKGDVTVRQVLSHTSGLPGWMPPFTLSEFYDREHAVTRLANQAPRWPAGTVGAYHALNYGHLIDELIRRATGLSLSEILRKHLADPLKIDFQLGAEVSDYERIAELRAPAHRRMPYPTEIDPAAMIDTFTSPRVDVADAMTPQWKAAELGAVNGHSNARSMAYGLSALAQCGVVAGSRLIRSDIAKSAYTAHSSGIDHVLGLPIRWGLGLALADSENPTEIPAGQRLFWGGRGGSIVVIDPGARMTFAYTMNDMAQGVLGSDRSIGYIQTLYTCLSQK